MGMFLHSRGSPISLTEFTPVACAVHNTLFGLVLVTVCWIMHFSVWVGN